MKVKVGERMFSIDDSIILSVLVLILNSLDFDD